ncbi:MAG: toxin-antitoxin system HicB family antitoxin [Chloroflexota bacterium]|nr:toxin-antitoxin system HicB family antitoxin [Chloroflexota bacterium]
MATAEKVTPERKLPLTGPVPADIAEKVAEYMRLPYTITMVYDTSGGPPAWVVGVEELPGCLSQGDTPDEAISMIREAMEGWLEVAVAYGDEIPPPKDHFPEHSGKFQVRLPVGLHGRLAAVAKEQEVSLNQLVTAILAEGVGWRPAGQRKAPRT